MEQIILKANERDLLGKKVKILRREKQIPAVLYGRKFTPLAVTLSKSEFEKVFKVASESTLLNIDIPSKEKVSALIRDIQRDPISDEIIHVDLYKVDMNREIQTEIPLHFVGIAPAVEDLEGNFITNKDAIKVECLPDKLVNEIEVDISLLKTFEDLIHIKNLNVPSGIKVLEEEEDIIAQVTPPLSEEELKELEEEAAATTEKAQIENIEAEAEKEKAEKEAEAAEETVNKEEEGSQQKED